MNFSRSSNSSVYAIRVIHQNKQQQQQQQRDISYEVQYRKYQNISDSSLFLFRDEDEFISLASALHEEFPHMDLDIDGLLLPDEFVNKSNFDTSDIRSTHDDIEEGYIGENETEYQVENSNTDGHGRASQLTAFLENILSTPEIVSSKAVSEFFCESLVRSEHEIIQSSRSEDNEIELSTESTNKSNTRLHHYFFEDEDTSFTRIDLSRKGSNSSSYLHRETVSDGSYLLWQFTVEQGFGIGNVQPIQFRVITSEYGSDYGSNDVDDLDIVKTNDYKIVHERDITWCTRSDGAFIEGFYQYLQSPRDTNNSDILSNGEVCLYFMNPNFARQLRVLLKTVIIPKDVYEVALLATTEQQKVDMRRDRAPLLQEILMSTVESDPITVRVELVEECDKEYLDKISHENNSECDSLRKFKQRADREVLARLKADKKVSYLQKEVEHLRNDLHKVGAERRVFVLSRKTIQDEMTKMSRSLKEEKLSHEKTKVKLEKSYTDYALVTKEVSLLKNQIMSQKDIKLVKDELESKQHEHEMTLQNSLELEKRVKELEDEKEKLVSQMRDERSKAKEINLHSKAEVEEARMMQRIQEGKVRELERSLSDQSSTIFDSHPAKAPRTKYETSNSKLDKEQHLKLQLVSLKSRHSKLVELMKNDPNNEKNAILVSRLEDAIQKIVAITSKYT